MSFRLRVFAALTLSVHLAACSEPTEAPAASTNDAKAAVPATAKAEAAGQKLVLAFGDSLYAGYGVPAGESLPDEIERALRRAGVVASVRNAGVSGDTSAAGRDRLVYTLEGLPRAPDLVLLGLGGNDMLRGLPPEQTEANLTAMLDELKRRGIPVILTGMRAPPNLGRDYVARFDGIYPKLAKSFGAGLDPFILEGVVTDRSLMLADRIHPSPAGIDRIAARLAPMVAERLRTNP